MTNHVNALCGFTLERDERVEHEVRCGECDARIELGMSSDDGRRVAADVSSYTPHVIVAGPARAGKTWLLRRLCAELVIRQVPVDVVSVAHAGSGVWGQLTEVDPCGRSAEESAAVISQFHARMTAALMSGADRRLLPTRVLMVDDLPVLLRQLAVVDRVLASDGRDRRLSRRSRRTSMRVDVVDQLREVLACGGRTGHVLMASAHSMRGMSWWSPELREECGTRVLLGSDYGVADVRALFGSAKNVPTYARRSGWTGCGVVNQGDTVVEVDVTRDVPVPAAAEG